MEVVTIVINSIQIYLNMCYDKHLLPVLAMMNRGVDY